ncbi:hypothetical protein PVL30_001971 [Lodderomyces elongisporus]|uniref:uncharacterized protein n=1 Tax=Lodderomyces elongisporus TaxID=36914 RepID=UPI00292221DB|nr:uncharacterized protein PVL30_001971 [Lodderomyces elongisporus]WLF78239.1 hypothetical protein PVL30_001971 [Lodderomyces elongisporus]
MESRGGGVKPEKAASNMKLISTSSGIRVSQACDRCRIKKIKCDGNSPCLNCKKAEFECKTSDKLTRRAFPKGYTENLEKKVRALEEELALLKERSGEQLTPKDVSLVHSGQQTKEASPTSIPTTTTTANDKVMFQSTAQTVQINNPIDQIFNLDDRGIIIGNDNLNFESQFNHLLINMNLPFLKITNSHNFLLNDPHDYLYNPSYAKSNQFHNKNLDAIYNPLTKTHSPEPGLNELPGDVYDLFIKLINNFKNIFRSKKELDIQIASFFLNYNVFIPIFDYHQFMENYDEFHTMYPFIFTYDDSTINGFNLSNANDYDVVNKFLMTIIQIYAMVIITNPTINLNLLLNHSDPHYSINSRGEKSIVKSLYDFLPYFNGFQISIHQLQTYLLLLYYSLLTNNKEKSLILSSLINAFIGILGINLNSKNLFFNDLSLSQQQRRNRVKIFWNFKVLLKCFNLKFGFKPSLNTTVINPVTIDRYFQLTPEKLSSLLGEDDTDLFNTMLKPSIEFLNLMNIVIPSSFSPNYYQYLKNDTKKKEREKGKEHHSHNHHRLDWILNEDDGEGNDGNLNYNFNQFLVIDKNLANWRLSLKAKKLSLAPFNINMGLPNILNITENDLYHDVSKESIPKEILMNYYQTGGQVDIYTASQLIKIQLNFHYILIRSMNYLNFIVDKELNAVYYKQIALISQEVLHYFLLIFDHVGKFHEKMDEPRISTNSIVMESLGLDVDEDGFVINDFSVKRRRKSHSKQGHAKKIVRDIPLSPFNPMLNGLSLTVINLKKSIVLQMLYLLICQMKYIKQNSLIKDVHHSCLLLVNSVDLFLKVFINYKPGMSPGKTNDDILFSKLLNDELREDMLHYQQQSHHDSDDEDDEDGHGIGTKEGNYYKSIDWDNENLDEDLKYLKICKFIKYRSQAFLEQLNNSTNISRGTSVQVSTNGRKVSAPASAPAPASAQAQAQAQAHAPAQAPAHAQAPAQAQAQAPAQAPAPAPAPAQVNANLHASVNTSTSSHSASELTSYAGQFYSKTDSSPYFPKFDDFSNGVDLGINVGVGPRTGTGTEVGAEIGTIKASQDFDAAQDLMGLKRSSSQSRNYP